MEIAVPDALPMMTLPDVAFFPQALLPLHIFEPRYREMLKDALATNRLFAVAGINRRRELKQTEPPHRVATVGIVRACQENDNGTSNLLLQGLARIEVLQILREEPYRAVRVRTLSSQPGASTDENAKLRAQLGRLISTKQKLGGPVPRDLAKFLKTVDDPETFVDLAAFSLCENADVKQRLLETLDVHRRLQLFTTTIRDEIETIKLTRKLQGHLADDDIALN